MAIRSFRDGCALEHGGAWRNYCGLMYCQTLWANREYRRCIEEIDRLRTILDFPYSCRVCMVGAVVAAELAYGVERLASYLWPALWAMASDDYEIELELRSKGHGEQLASLAERAGNAATAWISGEDTLVPSEVNVPRQAFEKYRLEQLVTRARTQFFFHYRDPASAGDAEALSEYAQVLWSCSGNIAATGSRLLDSGRAGAALAWFRGAITVLDDSYLRGDLRTMSMLAEAAYFVGSISRELGALDDAIRWGNFAVDVLDREYNTTDEAVRDAADSVRNVAIEMLGNVYFDQGDFGLSARYQREALAAMLGVSRDLPTSDLLEAMGTELVVSPDAFRCLFNLGNSLGRLGEEETYVAARLTSLMCATRLPDLVQYARSIEGRHTMRGLLSIAVNELGYDEIPKLRAVVDYLADQMTEG